MTPKHEQILAARETLLAQLDEATAAYESEAKELNRKLATVDAWLWSNTEHTAEVVIQEFVQLRDARTALKAKFDEADDVMVRKMDAREVWLLEALNTLGAESVRGSAGTAFITTKVRSSCSDWPLFWGWIKENDRFDMLEKRVAQTPINDLLKDGKDLPPAISTFTERVVTVRRS